MEAEEIPSCPVSQGDMSLLSFRGRSMKKPCTRLVLNEIQLVMTRTSEGTRGQGHWDIGG